MKKILIVNNNLDMGGIQKSLINMIKEVSDKYDISLLLFSKSGALLSDVPDNVNIITPRKCYSVLGLTKDELKTNFLLFFLKAFLIKFATVFSRRSAMKLLGVFQKKISGYDVVISYSHLANCHYFANGCGDFVLDKTDCNQKVCLIHCDYLHSGQLSDQNNSTYAEFDKIACCSESVRKRFLEGSHIAPDKVYTLRNFYDLDVKDSANISPYQYEDAYINVISVARLSPEKGIDRALEALYNSKRTDIRYYIVGDGPQKNDLAELVQKFKLEEQVVFLGEQENPYRYMLGADYLLVPSLHEAAPMVFDEAKILGLKVITTDTTSAMEMIGTENGLVCENHTEGIQQILSSLTKRTDKEGQVIDNKLQSSQLNIIINN